jgi:hypothetical protein
MAGKASKKSAKVAKKAAAKPTLLSGGNPQITKADGDAPVQAYTFTKYVKMAFFRGAALRPVPSGESKHEEVRYLDIREDQQVDEAQLARWIRQAAALPGWVP